MKILLLAAVCFLFTFITTNSLPSDNLTFEPGAVAPAPFFDQYPPYSGSCVTNGFSLSGEDQTEPCSSYTALRRNPKRLTVTISLL